MKLKNLIDIEFCSARRHYFASKKKYSNKLSSEIYFQVNLFPFQFLKVTFAPLLWINHN